MKNIGCWLFLLALFCATSLQAKEGNCFLWEVQGKSNTVYLLGSIHMMRSEDFPLDRCVDDAYQKSDKLVVELNIQAIDPMDMSRKMMALSLLPTGQSLEDQLSDETQKLLSDFNALPEQYQKMRPWYLALLITLQKVSELGYRADLGVDNYLINKASGSKPIISLETLEQQLAVLSGDSAKEQDLTLRLTLEQLSEAADYLGEMSSAWQMGDVATVYQLMEQPKQQYPQLSMQFDRQIIQRNYGMAEKISAMLSEKDDYLVVVGGGHLGGEQGVLSLLSKQGWVLKQQPKLGRSMLY